MAESQKQASSPANLKDKDSLLDMDFGKDFLSSWKTMSVAEGDAMDFDFRPVGKGKKKAFNFDKLDVDFALDGDLDKMSSFKVDMSDLDISSPPKRAGKSKESSNESDCQNHQIKQDRFSFSFDFNELDSFSFGSSLMKQGTQSKNVNSKEMSSSNCQGSGIDPTNDLSESEVVLVPEFAVSVGATTTKIESPVGAGSYGDLDPVKKNYPSNPERKDNCPLKSATLPIKAASVETRNFREKTTTTVIQEKNQESHQQEKITSSELPAQEARQDLTAHYVSVKEPTQRSAPEIQVEVCSQATKVHCNAGGDRNDTFESVCSFGINAENPAMENSATQSRSLSNAGERNKFESDSTVAVGHVDDAKPAQDDSYSDTAPSIRISPEGIHDKIPSRDAQNTNGELLLATLGSGGSLGKLSQMKEKQTGISLSKYFKRSDETESPSQQAPTSSANPIIGGSLGKLSQMKEKHTGISLSKYFKRSDETESPSQQAPISSANPIMSGGKRIGYGKVKQGSANEGRCGVHARDLQGGSNFLGLPKPDSGETNIGKAVQPGSMSNVTGLRSVGSCLDPSSSLEQTDRSTTQSCANPRLPASSILPAKNPNGVGDERRKLCSPRAGAKPQPSKSVVEKEIKPLRSAVRNVQPEGSTVSKMALSVRTEKQTPPTPHLKRKAFEGLNCDMLSLNPSKRLSPSATETRNGECSDIVVDKEVCGNKNPTDSRPYGNLNDPQTSSPITPQEVNMAELEIPFVQENDVNVEKADAYTKEPELEIPFVLENDVNVEKADAYTKELEDICNMLKKKHDEAKEILVRAIVNNNKLLMLNNPIYDEKIREVQKFAAELMCK